MSSPVTVWILGEDDASVASWVGPVPMDKDRVYVENRGPQAAENKGRWGTVLSREWRVRRFHGTDVPSKSRAECFVWVIWDKECSTSSTQEPQP